LLRQMIDRYPGSDLLSASRPSRAAEPLGEHSFTQPWPTQPGLVVNGAMDTDARLRAGEALARALPNCQRAVVPRARHLANLDNPDRYNSLLLHFFSQPQQPIGVTK
jgi:pimeloyl-ACP methyl ester carboxylesterase